VVEGRGLAVVRCGGVRAQTGGTSHVVNVATVVGSLVKALYCERANDHRQRRAAAITESER
jgi:hypothetical protein